MKNQPLVSVIIPTYQRSEFLIRAIESVLNQTYSNIEIIVVDDNDGDNEFRIDTKNNVKKYIDNNKIKYLEHTVNKGLPSARNTGIKACRGEFVAFLDDDDKWLPSKITKQIELFEKLDNSCGVIGSYWKVINEFDNKETTRRLKFRGDLSKILALNYFSPPSMVIIRKKFLDMVNNFDESFRWREDIELYYRLSFVCQFDFVEEVLVHYYQHPNALSTNFEKKLSAVIQYLEKHAETIKENPKPWSEINEHLAELYAVNGNKSKAFKHFWIAFSNQPFQVRILGKLIYALFLDKNHYKKMRNFK